MPPPQGRPAPSLHSVPRFVPPFSRPVSYNGAAGYSCPVNLLYPSALVCQALLCIFLLPLPSSGFTLRTSLDCRYVLAWRPPVLTAHADSRPLVCRLSGEPVPAMRAQFRVWHAAYPCVLAFWAGLVNHSWPPFINSCFLHSIAGRLYRQL